jgi:hypothetical protein
MPGEFFVEIPAKKEKAWRSLSSQTITYVVALACNRSDPGHYKFSSVRGAYSQDNIQRYAKRCPDERRVHHA